ncbi:DUF1624 domain-containing protein [Methylobrevis albus]|uniref:DUF1624 domain-containing protein n=1 Tax=Methylobrevis albus TaxID=2793297 RepID=A0A931I552_9HYPH|nr:heparan-alpha-glucosaminide N-acetyltransferase [Methylobrevis albus]MBH0239461.1 DUF1624 domain-containing protein [Methylobrevis albus]
MSQPIRPFTLPERPGSAVRPRSLGVDALRGLAILAMAIYHFTWDLGYFGLIGVDPAVDEGWRLFAKLIAASFLALVGAGLVLAGRDGFDGVRYGARLAKIIAAAILVSAATFAAFPDRFVYFGILHHIALASILALPFLRLPLPVVALAAVAAFLLPDYATLPLFDEPALWWTGLAPETRPANDFVPLFPWFSAVLAGIVIARVLGGARPTRPSTPASPAPEPRGAAVLRPLAFAGRHSLLIYLVHQPLLFGLVMAAAAVMPRDAGIERLRFIAACEATCQQTNGGDPAICPAYCGCVSGSLERNGFWTSRMSEEEAQSMLGTAAAGCRIDIAPEFLNED